MRLHFVYASLINHFFFHYLLLHCLRIQRFQSLFFDYYPSFRFTFSFPISMLSTSGCIVLKWSITPDLFSRSFWHFGQGCLIISSIFTLYKTSFLASVSSFVLSLRGDTFCAFRPV